MKPIKKIQKKLSSRMSGYKSIVDGAKRSLPPGAFTAPGSRNPKKG